MKDRLLTLALAIAVAGVGAMTIVRVAQNDDFQQWVSKTSGIGNHHSKGDLSPNACSVSIDRVDVSGCYYSGGQSLATVSVEVSWANSPGGNITVTLGAQTRTISPGGTTVSPQVVAFEISANGASGTVGAAFNASCNDSAPYTAPSGCVPNTCPGGAGIVGGIAFVDYNQDGIKQSGETNGQSGVTVNIFGCDANGNSVLVNTTTTDVNGDYYFSGLTNGKQYRVEFTLSPTLVQRGYTLGNNGTNSRTSVQFVTAPFCGSNIGVFIPSDYCDANPQVIVPCYTRGNPLVPGDAADEPALVGFPYNSSGQTNPAIMTEYAKQSQVGSLWGEAYDKKRKIMYSAAFLRRHTGLGPLGLGGIYKTDLTAPAATSTTPFVDLASIGVNLGSIGSNVARGLNPAKNVPNADPDAFVKLCKVGIGDIDISDNGDTLYFVNLNTRELQSLRLDNDGNPATPYTPVASDVHSYPLPAVSCSGGTLRPFGLKFYKGKVYLGAVCDALASQNKSDLRATIFEFTPGPNTFTTIFNFPLTYPKGEPINGNPAAGWFPWTDSWATVEAANGNGNYISYPSPFVADIEFDIDGSMVLGLGDRFAYQSGVNDMDPAGNCCYWGFAGGDVLRVYSKNGSFVLENNAKAGPTTGFGTNNNQGPGFGEFYNDIWNGGGHNEIMMGGLAIRPGSGQIMACMMDPLLNGPPYWSNGVRTLDNSNGKYVNGYCVFQSASDLSSGNFGKAAGLGDIELICALPRNIQIGNRVWNDANKNGVQDPCESPIQGAKVDLYDKNGVLVGATTTDANGEYYFDGTNVDTIAPYGSGGYTGLSPKQKYYVVVGKTASQFNKTFNELGISGQYYKLTTANTGQGPNTDMNDSDGALFSGLAGGLAALNGYPGALITTPDYGDVDHTFDFGFYQDFDYGDLPDNDTAGSYPTNGVNGGGEGVGPCHVIVGGLKIGALTDAEADGQPTGTANGDDANGSDDEDGVTFPSFVPGAPATVTISVMNMRGATAFLTGFFDWNKDGDFLDANEKVTVNVPDNTNGNVTMTVNVPANAVVGQSLGARFRLSTTSGLLATGCAPDGEVEDYMIQAAGFDYGDLPDSYGTTKANNGAAHIITPTLLLGSCVDAELDGQPNAMAGLMGGGDDGGAGTTSFGSCGTSGDDEDGVIFNTPMIPGSNACITVTAVNTTGAPAVLQAWIDFNGDGAFQAGEQLTTGSFAPSGANVPNGGLSGAQLCFTVPSTATFTGGQAMVRFRISSAGGLGPTGADGFGEVEDYKVPLAKLGNLVWNDYNNDGLQSAGEPGINGVTVNLTWLGPDNAVGGGDDVTYTTTTSTMNGSQGIYMFVGVTPGMYKVSVATPTGFIPGRENAGNNDIKDSDLHAGEMVNIPNPLTSMPTGENGTGDNPGGSGFPDNQDNLTFDFNFIQTDYGDLPDTYGTANVSNGPAHVVNPNLKLGSCVDGETDGQPEAMAGMNTGGDDNTTGVGPTGTASTCGDDEDGVVLATPMIPGAQACFTVNVTNATGAAAVLQAWIDFNGDGVFQPSEQLTTGNFAPAGAAVPNGGLTNATLCFTVPAGATFQGGNAFMRFRLSPAGGLNATGSLAGGVLPSGEVEDYKVVLDKIGNLVWNDFNNDGLQTAGEPGINGVTVNLIWAGPDGSLATAGDNVTYTTTTATMNGSQGIYMFLGLTPGTYKVVPVTPTGFIAGRENVGGNDVIDGDTHAGETVTIVSPTGLPTGENGTGDNPGGTNGFADNQDNLTFDFNYVQTDFGDLPNTYGTTSGSSGPVHIVNPNLKLGSCEDAELDGQPEAMAGMNTGGDDNNTGFGPTGAASTCGDDEDGVVLATPMVPGTQACFTVNATNTTGAAAVLQAWIDFNGDGQFQAGEQLNTGDFAPSGATVPNGGLTNAKLCFTVPATATFQGGNAFMRFRLSPTGGLTATGTLAGGIIPVGEVEDHKVQLVKLGNLVWNDYNNDGQQSAGEPGINGVTVNLTWLGPDNALGGGDDVIYTTTTSTMNGSQGIYMFLGLTSGMYKVSTVTPTGFVNGRENAGNNDVKDSDLHAGEMVNIPNPPTSLPTGENGTGDNPGGTNGFPDNQDNLTIDFSFIQVDYGDLPDTYGTTGVSNGPAHVVNPNLKLGSCVDGEADGQPDAMAGMVTGGDDNNTGFGPTGAASTCGNDEDGVVLATPMIPGAQACFTVNAMNATGAAAVLQAWVDFNGDGIFQPTEQLTTGDFAPAGATVPAGGLTNAKLCFTVPAGATFQGGASFMRFRLSQNGGLNATGSLAGGVLPSGEVEDHKAMLDKIGNLVWNDYNNDGLQTSGEPGINGVTVNLTWAGPDGNLTTTADNVTYTTITSTMNGSLGVYMFQGLIPGTYKVTPVTPTGFVAGRENVGANDVIDGDAHAGETVTIVSPTGLPTGENGTGDNPGGTNGFADNQDNLTIDFNYYQTDYGDLPNTYGTTSGSSGPVHIVNPNLKLGSCEDAELDGQPEAMAGMNTGGDDNNTGFGPTGAASTCGDDEDGVVLATPMVPGTQACFTVNATNTTGAAAVLQAWIDFNGDGQFQAGEQLTTGDFAPSGATVPNGGLTNAKLCFTVPATATFQGGNAFMRFRLSPTGGLTATGTLAGGIIPVGEVEDNKVQLVKLGNLVWNDYNNDGQQSAGEPGINGVTVNLTWLGPDNALGGGDDVIYTTTTSTMNGSQGIYMFLGLTSGMYKVSTVTPTGFVNGRENVGNDVKDSDLHSGEMVNIPNPPTSLPTGENGTGDNPGGTNGFPDNQDNLTIDFSFIQVDYGDLPDTYGTTGVSNGPAHVVNPNLKLGSCVDGEADGQPDAMAGMVTGGDDNNTGFGPTGAASTCGNDEDGVVLATPMIPGAQACFTVNAMNATGAAAVLQAWVDFNGDGIFQPTEQLTTGDFAPAGASVPVGGLTNAKLCFTVPAGATFQGGASFMRFRLSQNGGLNATGSLAGGVLPSGEVEDHKAMLDKIGNLVWNDYNNDGLQTSGEPGINGVTVNLTWAGPDGNLTTTADNVTYTTTTSTMNGSLGVYMFQGLIPGTYKVTPLTPTGFVAGRENVGANDVIDGDAHAGEVVTITNPTALPTGENGTADNPGGTNGFADNQDNLTIDFNYVQTDYGDLPNTYGTTSGSGGAVHVISPNLKLGTCEDAELDGQPEAMAGMNTGGDDNNTGFGPTGAASTCGDDEDGVVLATPLIPGAQACFIVNATNTTGAAAVLQAWIDFNGDGQFQASEQLTTGSFAPSGATVPNGGLTNATLCFTVPATATFQGGNAFMRFRLSPAGGLTATGTLAGGIIPVGEVEDNKVQLAKVGNLVWNDYNNDGQQTVGEPGINGVPVTLTWLGPNGVAGGGDDVTYATTTSTMNGSQGIYMFFGLTSGNYVLTPTTPAGYQPGRENLGSDVTDSDLHIGQEFTIPNPPTTLPTGENGTGDNPGGTNGFPDNQDNLTFDFNFVGVDYGDLPNTYGTLIASGGPAHVMTPNLVLGTKVDAESNGQPEAMAGLMTGGDDNNSTTPNFGGAGNDEDGVVLSTPMIPGATACFTVSAINTTAAAAVLQAWVDFNGDGQFQVNEQLTTGSFAPTGATVPVGGLTNAQLCFTVPANATFTGGAAFMRFRLSPTGGLSPNANPDLALPIGEVEDYKVSLAKVGNLVWWDYDNNGQQNPGEPGLNNAVVQLTWFGADGVPGGSGVNADVNYTLTTSTMNGTNGMYMFLGLTPGQYKLNVLTPPTSFTPTQIDQGSDVTDSDNPAGVNFTIGNPINLPLGENGIGDVANDPNFPDVQNNLTFDFGYVARDYGDLPDTYGTTIAGTGASQLVNPTLYLGTCADGELDGQPDAMAGLMVGGDDHNGSNAIVGSCGNGGDENGLIQLETPMVPGTTACFRISAVNATGSSAVLQAWVDFNGDGQFQAGEQLTSGAFAPAGASIPNGGVTNQQMCFDVPATATFHGGNAMIRLRLSQNGGMNPTGASGIGGIGEVEDYKVALAKIGNLVWNDYNNDGIQNEPGTAGLNNVTVQLVWAGPDGNFTSTNDNRTYTVTTSNMGVDGQYMIVGLIPGMYKASIPNLPANFIATQVDINGNAQDVTDADDVTGVMVNIPNPPTTLPTGENGTGDVPNDAHFPDNQNNLTIDFGLITRDFGDAPDTYGTTTSSNGPVHVINPILRLGTCEDGEMNGQVDAMAGMLTGGDDNTTGANPNGTASTCGDDEDGVIFETPMIPGNQACIRVTALNNTGAAAVLQMWVDWNGDGQFQPTDQVTNGSFAPAGATVPVGGLTNAQLCFAVPATATFTGGNAFVRFRLSPSGGLNPTGPTAMPLPQGEVEDHKVPLAKIGNLVWNDYNNDGIQNEPGTAGLNNITVQLVWAGPDGNIATAGDNRTYTVQTSNMGVDGQYMFLGLTVGTYKVSIPTLPANYIATQIDISGNSQDVKDADDPTGVTFTIPNPIALPLGENGTGDVPNDPNFPDAQNNLTFDFGLITRDFGDLPNTYGTTLGATGAVHVVSPTLKLGSCEDGEADGQPDAMAGMLTGGDDNTTGSNTAGTASTCGNDEDGIVFETPMIPGNPACVRVTAANTTGASAVLQMWVDWNGDGQFQASEQVITQSFAPTGATIPTGGVSSVQYCFDVPATATFFGGNAFVRFRLSPLGGLTATGPGTMPLPMGEVEDYKVPVACIGNYVWIDANVNGIQDESGILGINNVTVKLEWGGPDQNLNSTADNRTYTVITGPVGGINGKYMFCGLIPGQYKVSVPPFGYVPTLVIDVNGNTQDFVDADNPAGVTFTVPNPILLPTGENGTGDSPLVVNGFPDNQSNFSFDFGYLGFDFGDLPNTYGTTQAVNGAVHVINPDLYLGSCVDVDLDGQPDAMAGFMGGGDDGNTGPGSLGTCSPAGDDENGISFPTPMIPGNVACVKVTARNATGAGAVLQAWIDFNGDGQFQANEQLTTGDFAPTGATIPNGGVTNQNFCFTVPANATFNGGNMFARFRLRKASDAVLGPTGPAIPAGPFPTGEVEDYKLPLALVGNYVWMDNPNIDGTQDPTEMPLAGVKMYLVWAGEDGVFQTGTNSAVPSGDDRVYAVTTDANGRYEFRGLIPTTNYWIIPEKYTAANQAGADAIVPFNKILTIPNLPASDFFDSDGTPRFQFSIPNLTSAFLVTGENGLQDNTQYGFPDNQVNISVDFGFIDKPKIAAAMAIVGFQKTECGHFGVIMDLCIKNNSTAPLTNLQAALNLAGANAYGTTFLGLITAPEIVSSNAHQNPSLNAGYNGAATAPGINLFNGANGLLWPGEQVCVRIRFNINPTAAGAPSYPQAQASVSGAAVNFQGLPIPDYFNNGNQFVATDLSDVGTDPMSTNPNFLGDTGGSDDPTPLGDCWKTTQQLVGNDLVYVSIDASCSALVNASDVLEGEDPNCTDVVYPLGGLFNVTITTLPPQSQPVPNPIPASYVGQTLQYTVEHILTCNKTWGHLKVEDKLAPVVQCADIHLNCAITNYSPDYLKNTLGIDNAWPTVTDCSTTTISYDDTWHDLACGQGFNGQNDLSAYVTRIWTVKDSWGNTTSCTSYIYFHRLHIPDIKLPADVTVSCGPSANSAPSATGTPYVTAFGKNWALWPDAGFCELNAIYTDDLVPICDGTRKILRTWKLIDWCAPTTPYPPLQNPLYYIQVIVVMDNQGPVISCPANLTVTTDPFACCATADLPDVIITDNCSRINNISAKIKTYDPFTGDPTGVYNLTGSLTDFPGNNKWTPDTLGVYGYSPCLPQGTHTVIYTATDDCGNTSTCSFRLTVADFVPPVAACDQTTTVAIGPDDPADCYTAASGCSGAGVTWVKAKTFDDGSYDNCNKVKFSIRRMAPYSDCINALDDCEKPVATAEGDSIKFYCCEVGTTQTIILRVYQIDLDGSVMNGPDGTPLYNECMIQVEVQDKVKPVCVPPANVTVTCENFDPSLWVYGKANVFDNCCLDTTKVYQGQCGLTHTANYSQFDTVCNKGTIVRTFRAFDCHGLSSQCTQRIVVNYKQDYWVHFPDDKIVTTCDGTGNYGEPSFYGKDCELLGVSYEDQVYTVVPDACYKIERTWTIINWCTYNPNLPCIEVPNPNPNTIANNTQNLPGPIVSPAGTTVQGWIPTSVKVNPTDPQPTNYSIFYDPNVNCYKYKQIIKIIDSKPPVVNCPASPVEFCDLTPNDPLLWNESYWWDNVIGQHDLCEGPTDLNITGTDLCSGANIDIRYLLFLDLDGDGTMETVVSSTNLPGFNNVNFGNAGNPNFAGGTPRGFDERAVPFNQKYGFTLQTTTSGKNKTGAVRWNTQQSPATYTVPELPYGTHKIKWIVSDGCGNDQVCEYTFVVKDCKKPTVVCLNGLSVNIMPTGMIQMWASDFLQYAQDNCTPANQLKIGIRRSGTGTGFPVDGNGNPITSVTFTCADLGTQSVELWAIDKAGNADYCETYVIVQDNSGACPNNPNAAKVAGALATEATDGLSEGSVEIAGSSNSVPSFNFTTMSDNAGAYNFNAIPTASNSTITPVKDDNPLNGVSTYDLVLISKHILGLQPLNSPYKMIAADANKNGSITTFDIVELRKLILGIYSTLPNNTSWRFVDKSYVFPNQNNPFSDIFPENKSITNLSANQLNQNFVSIKVGDVNGSATANALMHADDRTAGTLLFDVDDRTVKAGETFTVHFKASEFVQGYQFTMNFPNLEVMDVLPGADMKQDNFGIFPQEGTITTSFDAPVGTSNVAEYDVKFRATKAGKLSELVSISSRITKAEAYNHADEKMDVAFRFNQGGQSTISGVGFELYQNQPNPFVDKTSIGFHLPEATTATLTVYDETGKLVYTQKGDFAKGYNYFTIDRALSGSIGVLYYKVETATDAASRKMIQTTN
jgi:hypothetical protein